jgi:hypothetical protein
MRHVVRTVAAARFALSTRRDLLLESLALRHQLRVLARSNSRFCASDRLLWLILRRVWPRWRAALAVVQPATIDRWHRDGFLRWWRRSSRPPGRPRIDSECRGLIRRLAAENCLWGAPRIHGELLKLGIAVSERTVSRYLGNRGRARSQTWPTFFANHLGQFTSISPLTSSYALDGDDVVQMPDLRFRQTRLPRDWPYVHQSAVVDPRASPRWTSIGKHRIEDHLCDRIATRNGSRGPPTHERCGQPTAFARRVDWSFSIRRRTTPSDLACRDLLTSSRSSEGEMSSHSACRTAR